VCAAVRVLQYVYCSACADQPTHRRSVSKRILTQSHSKWDHDSRVIQESERKRARKRERKSQKQKESKREGRRERKREREREREKERERERERERESVRERDRERERVSARGGESKGERERKEFDLAPPTRSQKYAHSPTL